MNLWLCHMKKMRTATYIVAAAVVGLTVWYVLGNRSTSNLSAA